MDSFTYHDRNLTYIDRGQGEAIVFVHGTPTHSGEYEAVISDLSDDYRCVAIDHLGFGSSDKPEDGDYSLDAHRERLQALLEHLGLTRFHLVVHDFGGVIGLPLTLNPSYQVKSITILNSWIWPLSETEPQMKRQAWLVSSGVFPFLYRNLNFSARFLIKMAWGKRVPLTPERHERYISRFPTRHQREGTVGFLKALFDFQNPNWAYADQARLLERRPVQVIWGKADKLLSTRNLARWRELLPGAEVTGLEDVGHFVAEEAPDEVAARLRQIIRKSS